MALPTDEELALELNEVLLSSKFMAYALTKAEENLGWSPQMDTDEEDARYEAYWDEVHKAHVELLAKAASRLEFDPDTGEYVKYTFKRGGGK